MSVAAEQAEIYHLAASDAAFLRNAQIIFNPDRWMPRVVPSVDHLLAQRPLISMTPFTPVSFGYLCRLVQSSCANVSKTRFMPFARVLRSQLRKAGDGVALDKSTVRAIFDIYQRRISMSISSIYRRSTARYAAAASHVSSD